jgi:hypothetical protein
MKKTNSSRWAFFFLSTGIVTRFYLNLPPNQYTDDVVQESS